MTVLLVDCETTGTGEGAEIIEAAWAPLALAYFDHELQAAVPHPCADTIVQRFRPEGPMEYGALATHHIIADDLRECSPSSECRLPECTIMIAHNVDFDHGMFGSPDCRRVCTLAMARRAWPHLDSHTQGALLYYLSDSHATARERLRGAHSASGDLSNLLLVLEHLFAEFRITDWDQLWAVSEEARVPTHWTFGKYGPKNGQPGARIEGSDPGYLDWWLKPEQAGADPYLLTAVRRAKGIEVV